MIWNFKEELRTGIERITEENKSLGEKLEVLKLVHKDKEVKYL